MKKTMAAALAALVLTAGMHAASFPEYLKMRGTMIIGCDKENIPESLVIPDGVTEIGAMAFAQCESLEHVTIPKSVKRIGMEAFYGCYSLAELAIPESVTEIGDGAFYGCDTLVDVTIPATVKKIGGKAFGNCVSLRNVTILSRAAELGEGLFNECVSLESVTIPATVKKIGQNAFNRCDSLKDVHFGGKKAQWEAIGKAGSGLEYTLATAERHNYNKMIQQSEQTFGYTYTPDPEIMAQSNIAFEALKRSLEMVFDPNNTDEEIQKARRALEFTQDLGVVDYHLGKISVHCTDGDIVIE